MGLHTGPVVVGTVGDDQRRDYAAVGETTNDAACLQHLAAPGVFALSESTYCAVREYVDCAPLGALTVTGEADPVTAYAALDEAAVRTRIEAAARGLTPFVGREQELRVLQGYLEEARRGRGQVVSVAGEVGIGKSRLLLEFCRAAEAQGARWVGGRCVALGGTIPYLPIVDALKRMFGIQEGDDEAPILQHVEEQTAPWGPGARAAAPYLRFLLSVDPGDPAVASTDALARRAGTFDALRALLLEASRRQPLVLAVEDLHWVDEQSGAVLAALIDAVPRSPVLLILTHRPGYAHPLGDRSSFTRLALKGLPPEESAALAGAVLQVTALPAPPCS
jgi:predicted ATPase